MTRRLSLLILPCLLAVGFAACGDDDPPLTPINENFEFRAGDKFTYNYYDRDSANARLATSKQVYVWTVLRTGLDTLSRKDVAEIEEVRFDATGQTETGRSKIYMKINVDGALLAYDLVGTALGRFSGSVDLSSYLDQVPKDWVTVGSTNDANARVLANVYTPLSITLNNVVIPPIDPFDITLKTDVRADHLGAMEVTVPAGTYTKAYVTDTKVFVDMTNKDAFMASGFPIPAGTQIINDSVRFRFEFDIDAGMISQASDSKAIVAAGLFPTLINGYEMELTAVERAAAE